MEVVINGWCFGFFSTTICEATQLRFHGGEDNMLLIWVAIEHIPNWNKEKRLLQGGSYSSISQLYPWCAPGVALLLAPASSNSTFHTLLGVKLHPVTQRCVL